MQALPKSQETFLLAYIAWGSLLNGSYLCRRFLESSQNTQECLCLKTVRHQGSIIIIVYRHSRWNGPYCTWFAISTHDHGQLQKSGTCCTSPYFHHSEVAKQFFNHRAFSYGPLIGLIADNEGQFTSTFLREVCKIRNMHNSFTKAYHQQTNGQLGCIKRTILSSLRCYVSDHFRDWNVYTSTLMYA